MPTKVAASAVFKGRMTFEGRTRDNPPVPVDYHPPLGDGRGYLPMELLLMSLAACSGQTVAGLLGKMKQPPREMEVSASGEKRDEHPTTFLSIRLEFVIRGGGVTEDAARQAVAMSEEKFCPVWAMLKAVVPMSAAVRIE
jgi:putative redox protein